MVISAVDQLRLADQWPLDSSRDVDTHRTTTTEPT